MKVELFGSEPNTSGTTIPFFSFHKLCSFLVHYIASHTQDTVTIATAQTHPLMWVQLLVPRVNMGGIWVEGLCVLLYLGDAEAAA